MIVGEVLSVAMFAAACLILLAGFPVAFCLAGTGLMFAGLGVALGVFDARLLGGLASRYFGVMVNEVLVAVPLFVFMGVMLERARVAEQLLHTMGLLFGRRRGGLAVSVIVVGMLLAASTGIVGATVVTMGLLSLPTMLRAGYDPRLACGTICASGTLGQIIPPSIVLVLLGDILQGAYAEAQRAVGNWAPAPISVIDLFAGAFLPGMILVGLYVAWVFVKSVIDPDACPALVGEDERIDDLWRRVADALLPPGALMLAVLGSILGGIATPTEAASVGCIGAIFLAARTRRAPAPDDAMPPPAGGARLAAAGRTGQGRTGQGRTGQGHMGQGHMGQGRAAILRPWQWPMRLGRRLDTGGDGLIHWAGAAVLGQIALAAAFDLRMERAEVPTADAIAFLAACVLGIVAVHGLLIALARIFARGVLTEVMRSTLMISSMVFVILLGASVFSLVFRGLGGDAVVEDLLSSVPGGAVGALFAVMAVMFVLGFFLDFIEIIFVVIPIVGPVLLQQDIDPLWFGILVALNLQTSFLTPPFGFALFYLRGVAPAAVTTMQIYRGVAPFVLLQVLALALVAAFPQLATWLPAVLFR
jgi:TRAP-type mannitol/chloroaromatic compound transport system permease large subunit